tara:strand:+ start:1941 stop:2651 length:711 start_codon:yes stop_codon:yes gene_type:complete
MHLNPWIFRWHGNLGVVASVLVAILIITGIALNHTERLNLDSQFVGNDWLLTWYGIAPERSPVNFRVGSRWLSEVDGGLFMDAVPVPSFKGSLVGAVQGDGVIVIASRDTIYLVEDNGQLVEKLSWKAGAISRIGHLKAAIYIQSGGDNFASLDGFLTWKRSVEEPEWALAQEAPAEVKESVLLAFRGRGLPWERVLLDLHSGRILGSWGSYLMDAAAVVLLFLVISGIYNWYIRR